VFGLGASAQDGGGAMQNLPSSKELGSVPGSPQRVNSLPMTMAVSPDGHWVVTVNAGYGTFESKYEQSLAVMDTRTGKVMDFPDDRTGTRDRQTLYSGLAFSADGKHVYASMASLTAPVAGQAPPSRWQGGGDRVATPRAAPVGNGIAAYSFDEGKIAPDRVIPIPLQKLAGSRRTQLIGGVAGAMGVPFPAAIAVIPGMSEKLLVADNLSDDVLLMDAATGQIVTRFDLSESDTVPGTYPVALAVSKDGARAFVALWNASEVVELDLKNGTVGRKIAMFKPADPVAPGTHPDALEMSPDGETLYVSLANRDAVAAVNVARGGFAVKGYFDTRLPGQSYFGAEPDALTISRDGSRLYVANMASDAVAVIDTKKLTAGAAKQGMVEPAGFIPTEWMPVSMGMVGDKLYVATAKGRSTGPNNFPQRQLARGGGRRGDFTYIATLLYGSLAAIDPAAVDLKAATAEVLESNRMKAATERIQFASNVAKADPSAALRDDKQWVGPIKHVIYVIKENRTYDQIFGDLKQNGKPVGNGDASLAMYGEATTPNQHELALQFGVLDNFFDSGEVSGDGHVWSNAAIGTDYLERNWQIDYRNAQRTYDWEGVVSEGYPLLQKIPDVAEPASGYVWGNVDAHGKTHYNFGEYISSTFCDVKKSGSSQEGPLLEGMQCPRSAIQKGQPIPEEWGGGVSQWPWAIPLIAKNVATKPELVGHFAPEAPDFNLKVPDQLRMNVFVKHFEGWVKDRAAGNDTMPNYITMRLGDDHTAGTTPGGPTPKSSVADNDLAVGRLVEAVSHSPYWDDTAIFILEDDAQNGADHVDAHRSLALVISKYAPHGTDGGAVVDSRFYSTVSVIRTMETLLGLPPMNNNDALSSMMGTLFTGPGDQAPFAADTRNRDNGLIYTANAPGAIGARASAKMDFTHADRADPRTLNVILWKDAMGDKAVPAQLLVKPKKTKKDDDD
jgi:DNA-binding beta-propeller fold protein YncE